MLLLEETGENLQCLLELNWKHSSHMRLTENCNETTAYCGNRSLTTVSRPAPRTKALSYEQSGKVNAHEDMKIIILIQNFSFCFSPSPTAKATSKRSKDGTKNFEDQLEHLEDNMESLAGSLKRSEEIDNEILEDKSKRSEDKSTTKYELSMDNFSDGNEYDQNLHDVAVTRRDTADSETGGSRINSHHIVGRSWELIHHYPTAYLPSLIDVNTTILNNTTMHSEYLGDNNIDGVAQYDADDVTQYERAEKSRRKPRVSLVRPVRSIETDYEVREISEISNPMAQSSLEESGHVVMVNTKAIKRDGTFYPITIKPLHHGHRNESEVSVL